MHQEITPSHDSSLHSISVSSLISTTATKCLSRTNPLFDVNTSLLDVPRIPRYLMGENDLGRN